MSSLALDGDREEAILVLLDFSSAFNCLDHQQLLKPLAVRYEIQGKVVDAVLDRTQRVVIASDGGTPSLFLSLIHVVRRCKTLLVLPELRVLLTTRIFAHHF